MFDIDSYYPSITPEPLEKPLRLVENEMDVTKIEIIKLMKRIY